MKLSLFQSAARFAHLSGGSARGPRLEDNKENDERKQRDGESDDDYAKRMKALDDDDEDADAEDGDDDLDAENNSPEDPDAEDSDDEKDKVKKARKAGRQAERTRCMTIFSHSAASGRPELAATLAFTTNLSAEAAVEVMKAIGAHKPGSRLDERMSRVKVAQPGPDGGAVADPSSPSSVAARIIAAGKKARGEA